MPDDGSTSAENATEQIYGQIEGELEAGGVRDLWLSIRRELAEGGPESVRTYLEAEYQTRKSIVQSALDELITRLEETA